MLTVSMQDETLLLFIMPVITLQWGGGVIKNISFSALLPVGIVAQIMCAYLSPQIPLHKQQEKQGDGMRMVTYRVKEKIA